MKSFLYLLLIPSAIFAWDFTQEYNSIPVNFDGIKCQSAWGTGYNYIHPVFVDIDGDNDNDLILGSDFARTSLYINEGNTQQYMFAFRSDSFINSSMNALSQISNRPQFCDIDNDGDYDFFLAEWLDFLPAGNRGRIYYFKNIGNNIDYEYVLEDSCFQDIIYGNDIYPTFVDIDNDGDSDMFIGLGYMWTATSGRLAFYFNEGTPDSASMVLISDYFMNIDLGNYCIPSFIDIDNDNDYDMFLGSEDGKIHFYRNDGTPEVYNFILVTDNYFDIDVGFIASPTFCDIDGDGDYDLFVGERSWGQDNGRGDINYYENIGTADSADFELVTQNFIGIDIGLAAYPAFADIDNNGLNDMFIGDIDGNINYFSNIGTDSLPEFSFTENAFQNIWAQYQSRPTFGDLDNDGDLDLLVGRGSFGQGSIYYYRNDGAPELPDYTLIESSFLGINYMWCAPRLIDIDDDGDLDLFVGHAYNQVVFWENRGTPDSARFVLNNTNYLNTPYIGNYCPICFGDVDNDGDYDLIRAASDDSVAGYNFYLIFYRNIGTSSSPNFVLDEEHFLGLSTILESAPYLEDIDNDGDMDLFWGGWCGGVSFWRNNEISGVAERPPAGEIHSFALYQNYPNPFNSNTLIQYDLPYQSKVKLEVFNILGQSVAVLVDETQTAGYKKVIWNNNMASGIYIHKITIHGANGENYSSLKKMILLK